jgi:hypothetical protein
MGSTFTFLKDIPPELLVEYIIPCLQPVEVKQLMQTCRLYYKIGKSQMYKHFIYCLNYRLNKLHPALILQQFDSFNADYYPEIHNRIVYGDLLLEVYFGVPPDTTIQSYNYTLGFWIHHGEESRLGTPQSVKFGQDNIPEPQGTIRFQLTASNTFTQFKDGRIAIYVMKRRIWEADSISISSSGLQIHKTVRVITESVVTQNPFLPNDIFGGQMSYLRLKTPYLSGSTLVVPSTLNSGTKED